MSEEIVCQKCGCGFTLRDGYDNTGFCDDCAQNIAVQAEAFVIAHREDFEAMKQSSSMDIDVNFLGLCDAVLPVEDLYEDPNQPKETKP